MEKKKKEEKKKMNEIEITPYKQNRIYTSTLLKVSGVFRVDLAIE